MNIGKVKHQIILQVVWAYNGSVITGGVAGEWAEINVGEKVYVNKLELMATPDYINRTPEKFHLLGSDDGNTWTTLLTKENQNTDTYRLPNYGAFIVNESTFTPTTGYQYYRFVVESINADEGNADGYFSLGQFRLFGVKYPSQVTESNGIITLNTSVFNVVKSGEGITGQTYQTSSQYSASTGIETTINNASYDVLLLIGQQVVVMIILLEHIQVQDQQED